MDSSTRMEKNESTHIDLPSVNDLTTGLHSHPCFCILNVGAKASLCLEHQQRKRQDRRVAGTWGQHAGHTNLLRASLEQAPKAAATTRARLVLSE